MMSDFYAFVRTVIHPMRPMKTSHLLPYLIVALTLLGAFTRAERANAMTESAAKYGCLEIYKGNDLPVS